MPKSGYLRRSAPPRAAIAMPIAPSPPSSSPRPLGFSSRFLLPPKSRSRSLEISAIEDRDCGGRFSYRRDAAEAERGDAQWNWYLRFSGRHIEFPAFSFGDVHFDRDLHPFRKRNQRKQGRVALKRAVFDQQRKPLAPKHGNTPFPANSFACAAETKTKTAFWRERGRKIGGKRGGLRSEAALDGLGTEEFLPLSPFPTFPGVFFCTDCTRRYVSTPRTGVPRKAREKKASFAQGELRRAVLTSAIAPGAQTGDPPVSTVISAFLRPPLPPDTAVFPRKFDHHRVPRPAFPHPPLQNRRETSPFRGKVPLSPTRQRSSTPFGPKRRPLHFLLPPNKKQQQQQQPSTTSSS